jgi:hypothetical protein
MLILSAEEVQPVGAAYPEAGRIQYRQKVFERLRSFDINQRQQALKECQKYLDSHTRGCLVVEDPASYTLWTYVPDAQIQA